MAATGTIHKIGVSLFVMFGLVARRGEADDLPRAERVGFLSYDLRDGSIEELAGAQRDDVRRWSCTRATGAFRPLHPGELVLDWGDFAPTGGVGRFEIGYASNKPGPLEFEIVFYSNENGFNSVGRDVVAQFRLSGLPGAESGVTHAWIVSVAPGFGIVGGDLETSGSICEGRGLPDFGYTYHVSTPLLAGDLIGPLIAAPEPNAITCAAPGAEDAYDVFLVDANAPPPPPNNTLIAGVNTRYDGSYILGVAGFSQFYLALDAATGSPGCPKAGCATADFYPPGGNCVVDLSDLSVQLAHFGQAAGAIRTDGDIHPAGGDGDVDLNDLALLLAAFGTDCR